MECPVCGGKPTIDGDATFTICPRCRETLTRDDLVKHATWTTRQRYLQKNR